MRVFEGREYLQTIAPAKDIEGLAQLILDSEWRIDWDDRIITYSAPRIVPKKGYMEMPVNDEKIIRFYKKYWELVDGEIGREE